MRSCVVDLFSSDGTDTDVVAFSPAIKDLVSYTSVFAARDDARNALLSRLGEFRLREAGITP